MAGPPGGIASALGAAISGGFQGYQQQKQFLQQQQQTAIQMALAQDQLNELPKKHMEADLANRFQVMGDAAYSDPSTQELYQQAYGRPLLMNPDVTQRNLQRSAISKAYDDFINPQKPDTPVAQGPTEPTFHDPRTQAAYEALGPEPPFRDPVAEAAWQKYQTAKEMSAKTGIPLAIPEPTVTESPKHKIWMQQVEQLVKSEVPAPMMQRVLGGMNETIDNLTTAQKEFERLYPGIEQPDDPNKSFYQQQYNTPLDLAKAKAWKALGYQFFETPLNKAIQASSLGNVQGWANIVPGRINSAIISKLGEHQSSFGNETPRASYMRNKELIELLKKNKLDLMGPAGLPAVVKPGATPADAPAEPAAAPAAAAPATAPAPATPAPAAFTPKKGETMKLSEVRSLYGNNDALVLDKVKALKAAGINVVDDTKPKPPPFTDWKSVRSAYAPHIGPGAPVQPWTLDSFLHDIGVR